MNQVGFTTVDLEPLGQVYVGYTDRGICCLTTTSNSDAEFASSLKEHYAGCVPARDDSRRTEWAEVLSGWLAGRVPATEVPLDLSGVTAFDRQVMGLAMAIPRGEVRTYGWLARAAGKPGASRAVGGVMRRNPVPFIVPCHRVVASSGVIGNYSMGGPAVKARLLELEGVDLGRLKEQVAAVR